MSWGTEKTLEAPKMTQHITAKFIGHGCIYKISHLTPDAPTLKKNQPTLMRYDLSLPKSENIPKPTFIMLSWIILYWVKTSLFTWDQQSRIELGVTQLNHPTSYSISTSHQSGIRSVLLHYLLLHLWWCHDCAIQAFDDNKTLSASIVC